MDLQTLTRLEPLPNAQLVSEARLPYHICAPYAEILSLSNRGANSKSIMAKRQILSETDLHRAARQVNLEEVASCLKEGYDPNQLTPQGFNAIHLVVTSEISSPDRIVKAMKLLIRAGVDIEMKGAGGRTVLFLAAEFCTSIKPIELLLEYGADPLVTNDHNVSIVTNARSSKVRNLLSKFLKQSLPDKEPKPRERRLPTTEWRQVRKRLVHAFESLNNKGLLAVQGIGQNQGAGFDDCSEMFRKRGGPNVGLSGICFTSKSDEASARETGQLYLAFWGAPRGADKDMIRVGTLVVDEMQNQGLVVKWNGSANDRPVVLLGETMKVRT